MVRSSHETLPAAHLPASGWTPLPRQLAALLLLPAAAAVAILHCSRIGQAASQIAGRNPKLALGMMPLYRWHCGRIESSQPLSWGRVSDGHLHKVALMKFGMLNAAGKTKGRLKRME